MNKLLIPSAALLLAITGCAQSVPGCSDNQTTGLVKEIADGEMAEQLGPESAKLFSYKVEAIRTTNTNDQTGAHECAAELKIVPPNPDDTSTLPITYTVEVTDNGEDIYVNVFGL